MNDVSTQNRGHDAVGSVASLRPWRPNAITPMNLGGVIRRPNTEPTRPSEPCARKPYHRHGHRPPEHST